MKTWLPRQDGSVTITVLAFMVLAVPLLLGFLSLSNALLTDSRVKTRLAKNQYSANGIGEYLEFLLEDPDRWQDLMDAGGTDTVNINGEDITFTVNQQDPQGDEPEIEFQPFVTTKEVTPETAPADTLTTFTYTITAQNVGTAEEDLLRVYDGLPPGFSYVTGSASGVTTSDPILTVLGSDDAEEPDRYMLTWTLPEGTTVAAGGSVQLSFEATASVAAGNYCNSAWVDPGGETTSSGMTARIQVGSPSSEYCVGQNVVVTSTVDREVSSSGASNRYTYTISITNSGDTTLHLWWIKDKLPPGFTYVNNSTSGVTNQNPWPKITSNGRQRLNWWLPFFFNSPSIAPGETKTLTFQADAQLNYGNYWNEVWIFFTEYEDEDASYSWPSALVMVMDTYQVTATDASGDTIGTFEVWMGEDSEAIHRWVIGR